MSVLDWLQSINNDLAGVTIPSWTPIPGGGPLLGPLAGQKIFKVGTVAAAGALAPELLPAAAGIGTASGVVGGSALATTLASKGLGGLTNYGNQNKTKAKPKTNKVFRKSAAKSRAKAKAKPRSKKVSGKKVVSKKKR